MDINGFSLAWLIVLFFSFWFCMSSFFINVKLGFDLIKIGFLIIVVSILYIWILGFPLLEKIKLQGVLGPAKSLSLGYTIFISGVFVWLKENLCKYMGARKRNEKKITDLFFNTCFLFFFFSCFVGFGVNGIRR